MTDHIDFVVEPLNSGHNRENFSCEVDKITNYCKFNARRDNDAYKVRVFVACESGTQDVIGFYSLVLTALVPSEVSDEAEGKFGRVNVVPAIYLAMVGRAIEHKGRGVGEALLVDAFKRSLAISENAGTYALALDALNEKVATIYEGYGFEYFTDGELKMYITLKLLRDAVGE